MSNPDEMFITSVSLDLRAKEISRRMPNFSAFVRQCCVRWASQQVADHADHIDMYDRGKCWPHSPRGLCFSCWPDGPPDSASWRSFTSGLDTSDGKGLNRSHGDDWETVYDLKWIEEAAKTHNERLGGFNFEQMHFDRWIHRGKVRQHRSGRLGRILRRFKLRR